MGLIGRWFISGHAPWSNAYESVIYSLGNYISWIYFFKKKFNDCGATAILSSLLLMVAALNWLDQEITNLVPVLNSYWLIFM